MATAAVQTAPGLAPTHPHDTETKSPPSIRSNYGPYLASHNVGWLKPTTLDTPISDIRHRFETDGYVWIKNLIPRDAVLDMRAHYFSHMAPTGILKPGTSPRDGIFDPSNDPIAHSGVGGSDLPEDKEKVRLLTEAHGHDEYWEFLAHPALREFIRSFMQWDEETCITRNMLRHNCPGGLSTGVHYDRIFLRAGEAEFLTAWIPIGDCKADGGGLVYLEGSHELGKGLEREFMERARAAGFTREQTVDGFNVNMARDGQLSHDMEAIGREFEGRKEMQVEGMKKGLRWLVADYEAGDVVFHTPYLVHGAGKNDDAEGRIRLSSDVRFYEKGAKLDERWMKLWLPNDGL